MSQLTVFLTLSLTAMYLEPISSRSALVVASKSSKRLTSDCSIRDSSPKPGDAILESTGEMDLVTMSRIFVGTVGLLAPGSPFKCWSSNLCGEKSQSYYELRSKSHHDDNGNSLNLARYHSASSRSLVRTQVILPENPAQF